MAFANNTTLLFKKIVRRLGLRILMPHLEEMDLGFQSWLEPLEEDTLDTYSRFFPLEIMYPVNYNNPHDEEGWYFIDEKYIENKTVIGVRDLDFRSFSNDVLNHMQDIGYGFANYQALQAGFSLEDIGNVQMAADISSLFNQGMFLEFKAPNKFRLSSSTNMNITRGLHNYKIILLIKHDVNLLTINPTMMEVFEELAMSDIANFLYQELKYYDGLETIYANIDLKLDELAKWAEHREEVVNTLDESHVSAANPSCPIMLTV